MDERVASKPPSGARPGAYHDAIWEQVPVDRTPPPGHATRGAFLASLLSPGDDVLDLGCGDGLLLESLVGLGIHATGADVSGLALERAAGRQALGRVGRVQTVEGAPLPFPEASFDAVLLSETLSHALDGTGLLAESLRVLRPGGRLGVTVPDHPWWRRLWDATAGHSRAHHPAATEVRRYTRRSLDRQLREAGFDTVRIRAQGLRHRLLLAEARRR